MIGPNFGELWTVSFHCPIGRASAALALRLGLSYLGISSIEIMIEPIKLGFLANRTLIFWRAFSRDCARAISEMRRDWLRRFWMVTSAMYLDFEVAFPLEPLSSSLLRRQVPNCQGNNSSPLSNCCLSIPSVNVFERYVAPASCSGPDIRTINVLRSASKSNLKKA